MDFGLENVIERIDGNFICVFHGQSAEFSNLEELKNSGFGKECTVASISARDNKIIVELKARDILIADSNADWAKEHEKKFGVAPSFF